MNQATNGKNPHETHCKPSRGNVMIRRLSLQFLIAFNDVTADDVTDDDGRFI